MRKYLLILLCFLSLSASATNYYVKNGGNDAASGLDDANAWETLSKVTASSFNAGDTIFFKRGSTFRGYLEIGSSGSAESPIVFDAYGSGDLPKILDAKDISLEADWENHSGNIWKTIATAGASSFYVGANDIANLIFNNEASCGVKKTTLEGCTAQGYFFFNMTDNLIYIYSDGNPGAYYTHIEVGGNYREHAVKAYNKSYLTIRYLDVRYSGNNGIFIDRSSNVLVEHCNCSWIGGWYYDLEGTRMGNGIGMWLTCSNITVRYNRIDQCYDAGISPQGTGTYAQSNISMYYNVISNFYYGYEIFTRNGATLTNIDFYNNTCYNAGGSWSMGQGVSRNNAEHIRNYFADIPAEDISGCNIKNNIFSISSVRGLQFDLDDGIEMDNNLWYVDVIGTNDGSTYVTLADWISGTQFDDNSVSGNPLFTIDGSDFTLQSSSPAIDAGVNVGLTKDYLGNTVPYNGAYDIGAYEYSSSPPVIPNLTGIVTYGGKLVTSGGKPVTKIE